MGGAGGSIVRRVATLGVNIDHVATVRQARYREIQGHPNAEPDPVEAALAAVRGGALGITAHLREDRRHIQDRDIFELKERIGVKLNLEMGISEDIVGVALRVRPEDVCLVPENRQEVTTEGGLDVAGQLEALKRVVAVLREAGARVSLFVDPDGGQLEAAAETGAEFVELHTGAYANAFAEARAVELEKLVGGAECALGLGLRVNAGHGLNYKNTQAVLALPGLEELNIGHSIVSRAVAVGMEQAVREMCAILARG
jgi:pyridoxine 5-phosphate synthase